MELEKVSQILVLSTRGLTMGQETVKDPSSKVRLLLGRATKMIFHGGRVNKMHGQVLFQNFVRFENG